MGPATSLGLSNLAVLYSTAGFDPAVTSGLISFMGLCLIGGKLIYGQLVDRLGGRRSNYAVYGAMILSFLLCCLAHTGSIPAAVAAMALFGLGLPVSCMSQSVWAKDLLGDAGFAHGLKWLQSLFALGILLFGPVPGMLADAFGSYEPAYALFFLMTAVSLLLMGWVSAAEVADSWSVGSRTTGQARSSASIHSRSAMIFRKARSSPAGTSS